MEAACPASTTKALQVLSKEAEPICYWRVIKKKKGELFAQFPNGREGQASLLENEGFEINYSKKAPLVLNFEPQLSEFA